MPRGYKIVDWTPANETKLLHAIIAVHDIKLDYAEVAKQFGIKSPFSLDFVILSFLKLTQETMSPRRASKLTWQSFERWLQTWD